MASQYRIQVIDNFTGEPVATWEPGGKVETDLVEELVLRVRTKGVGVGRTAAHVEEDVRAALQELLYALKLRV